MRRVALTALMLAAAGTAWAQDTKLGEKVYTEQKCAVCHSIGGKGNQKGPLDDVGTKLTADEIRLWIVDAKTMTTKTKALRKPPMRDYKLPPDQLDGLVAYLQTLKKK